MCVWAIMECLQKDCYISNLEGDQLILIKPMEDPKTVGTYFQVTFLESGNQSRD